MPDEPRQGDVSTGNINISGTINNVSGNAAVGMNITQVQAAELRDLFTALKEEVEREAPPEVRDEAVQQADALEQATTGPTPDVSVMVSVKNWFLEHAPTLVGAVTSVIINPIVGKVVQAAGDAIAAEYRRHFPEAAATDQP